MTKFRPCIDLHNGQVKQIVGSTFGGGSSGSGTGTGSDQAAQRDSLGEPATGVMRTNHVSEKPAEHFARLYRQTGLEGAHVIMLGGSDAGSKNEQAARRACEQWPGHLQVGGGITAENAGSWLAEEQAGRAGKVIVTSYLFPNARFSLARLQALHAAIAAVVAARPAIDAQPTPPLPPSHYLVIDLSCKRCPDGRWVVATDKWKTLTDFALTKESIALLEPYCSEFLVHATDLEGLQSGIDEEIVRKLAEWCSIPVTYAGGARSIQDFHTVKALSGGKVDLTVGSALDLFGGSSVTFHDCLAWNQQQEKST